jgi:CzcA family heavy metal efflux pump
MQFRFVVLGVAAVLVLFGATQLGKMPVDVFPEYAPPIVEVQTEALGLSADEVESLITLNLEELLSGVPWLESIRSESVTGLSSIVLTFKRGTDIMDARQMIQERLTLAYTLPNVAKPPVILQPMSSTSRFMMVGISSDKIDPTELSLLARWTIKPRLLGVNGVANVAIWGQRLRQLHVHIDPDRLHDVRVIQEDIIAAAGDALWVSPLSFLKGSAPGTGGWVDNPNQRLSVQHTMPIQTPEDMAKIPVTPIHLLMTGKKLTLGEVAEVTFTHPPMIGDAIVQNVEDGNGLIVVIEKFPNANTLEVTREVEQALTEMSRGLPGVEIDTSVFRLATYAEDSIDNLTQALIVGAVLVLLVVGAFLFNWRSTLVSIVAIGMSILVALLVLYLTGATLNTMLVAGLIMAAGVVIDDAVVDADGLLERLRARKPGDDTSIVGIIMETTQTSQRDALYAVLIVLLAVMPIFFMGGVGGAFFVPMALSYVLAAVASMVVALALTPALNLMLFKDGTGSRSTSPVAAWLQERYEGLLRSVLAAKSKALLGAAVVVVIAVAMIPLLGQSLLPPLQEGNVLVNWDTPPGTSHPETYRITSRVSEELRGLPGVRSVNAHVGRAVTGDQVVGINSSQIWINLDPDADQKEGIAAIRATINGYPGIDRSVQTYLRDGVSEVLTGERKAIVVRIYGQKRDVLVEKADEVREALSGIDGLVDLQTVGQMMEPQIKVKVDLDKAGPVNVKPGEVRRASATVFSGLVVGYLFEDQKIYEVVVWGGPETRQSLSDLEDLWVEKVDRTYVRLGDVADVGVVPVPTVIRHEQIAPYVDVVANVNGRDPGSVVDDIEDQLEKVSFPLEYYAEILGEYAERENVQRRMTGVVVAALIGIFLLLQACFRSWRMAFVTFLSLPVAVAGGILAVPLGGGVVSLGSIVGFLAVLGIAARYSVVLINHFYHLEQHEGMAFGEELVMRGTRDRLAGIVASALAIVAALLPFVFLGNQAGLEIVQPTAIVIIGGVVTASLVALFVLPPLYLMAGEGASRRSDLMASESGLNQTG